ncbi:chromate transporter [Tepidimonas taiwanensis]|uniref:Putative chromate transport protein n=1 Tax=Tepidimonas taiwanensis TaxID=307486 RepID=A0A554X7W1_9BURK|nr:chromate transporter [Tepidimonas taiwanensis]TSE31918.1 putative chromate transport protein [Tepidimonas taiwanensis]UBQ06308.1 chromate transporter [Tepidimonas taiwanensis]
MSAATEAEALAAPRSPAALFWACTVLALQGFGGVLAVVQRELVERRRWLTREQFLEDWAAAQVLPGPNVVNLALMIGGRHFGWRGAVAALSGMLLAPLVLLLAIAVAFSHVAAHPVAQGALRGMGAVAAGLIVGTALRLLPALAGNVLGLAWCAVLGGATFVAVAILRWPLAAVLAVTGGVGWALAARRLRHRAKEPV